MTKYLKTREGSLEDLAKQMQNKVIESDYQDKFKKELDKAGKPIGQMTGAEKKAFFNKIDKMHTAKNEEVKEQKDRDIKAVPKYSKAGGFYYWDRPVKYNSIKKFYYHPKGAKPYPPGRYTKKSDKYEEVEEQKDNAYAIGMAAAMKAKNDQPPLKKSTITKAHDIAKSIEKDQKEDYTKKDVDKFHTKLDKLVHKSFGHSSDEKKKEMKEARWEIEGRVSYKGIGSEDSFHMVIDAPTESAAERKAYDELDKARQRKKIGPGGGGSIDDAEIEYIEKTNDKLSSPETGRLMNSYDPTQKEEVHPHVKKMIKDGESDEKIKKMHPELKDDELEKLKETHSFVTNKQNEKQKEVGGEKEPIKTKKNEWKTFAMMAAELREKKEDKKEMQAGDDTRDKKVKTMTGEIATTPEMNPKVDYKY